MLYDKGIVSTPEITEERKKMAILPQFSEALDNRVGGAPGVKIQYHDATIFCLPGVPSELKDIWERGVKQWLLAHITGAYYEEIFEFEVVDESVFAPFIAAAMEKNPGTWIKSMPKRYGTTRIMRVWISARNKELGEAKRKVRSAIQSLQSESGLSSSPADPEEDITR
jgi:molybdopterin-biosynthesis enzyme MoeA-like protein